MAEPIFTLPKQASLPFIAGAVSFGQLYASALEARETLLSLLSPEEPVCLAGEDKPTLAAALLATLSGGPPLLLPHANNPRVLEELRASAGYRVAIGSSQIELPEGVLGLVLPIAPGSGQPPEVVRRADDGFLSLFTGGSTGRPRLWPKTVKNLMGEAASLVHTFQITPNDVVLSCVPPVHIYGLLFGVLAPLLAGSRLVPATPLLPAEITCALKREAATIFIGAPIHYHALSASAFSAPGLRLAFSSGGMLEEKDAAHFTTQTGLGVVEVYGSTETGGVATRCRAGGETDWTPFPVVRFAVKDGRLCCDSPYLSPDLPRDAEGFFTTGDRAAPSGSGRFALLGRADGIAKVGGKRVDLDEVEQALKSVDGVKDACVLAVPTSTGRGNELVALVVFPGEVAVVRARLADLLAPPARPRRILKVKRIPTTPAGKRDHEACRALLEDRGSKVPAQ